MPRIARLKVKWEPTVYHVMSRTALDGFVLRDVEKDFLLDLIKRLSHVYFAELFGFCLMGKLFHLLVRMHPGADYSNEVDRFRYRTRYFTDSGVIGSKEFVAKNCKRFKTAFQCKRDKITKQINF